MRTSDFIATRSSWAWMSVHVLERAVLAFESQGEPPTGRCCGAFTAEGIGNVHCFEEHDRDHIAKAARD